MNEITKVSDITAQDLADYFSSCSWYKGRFSSEEFDSQMDSILNDLSHSNYYPENYVIGNAQYLFLRERNRTYVGGPTNGLTPALCV